MSDSPIASWPDALESPIQQQINTGIKPKRRRATRSVTGCLTCRHRRVKCVVQTSASASGSGPAPICDNCRRLRLVCNPSFSSNFMTWTPDSVRTGTRRSGSRSRSHTPRDPNRTSPRATPQSPHQDSVQHSSLHVEVPKVHGDPPPDGWDRPQDVLDVMYWSPGDDHLYDTHYENLSRAASQQLGFDHVESQAKTRQSEEDHQQDLPFSTGLTKVAAADTLRFQDNQLLVDTGTDMSSVMDFSSPSMESIMWSLAPPMPLVYGNSHGDMPLLNDVEAWVPDLLTLKNSMWNPYKFMVNSTLGQPNSPLRQGILSWTCSYLSFREHGGSHTSDIVYYTAASEAVKSILNDLSTSLSVTFSATKRDSRMAERLYLLLSTTFFLCSRDDMLSNHEALHSRLDEVKNFFEQNWHKLRNSLTALESRLLVWLAYLDLRSSLFRGRTALLLRSNSSGQSPRRSFIGFLTDVEALRGLRDHPTGQSYLSECFGDSYPRKEIEEDLVQEPCHRKCDDIVSILSNLNAFEEWNDKFGGLASTDTMAKELRDAKIQVLRANIARVKAECAVLFDRVSYEGTRVIDRTAFHAMTVTALHLSATILLNRIVEPNVRTDPEAQAAARELVRIAQRLRKAKYLERPRWLIWPLPLFVAGIEIEDEIYQEWLLGYISELEHWGTSLRRMRRLLENIIERQQEEGKRVCVREMVDRFDAGLIV